MNKGITRCISQYTYTAEIHSYMLGDNGTVLCRFESTFRCAFCQRSLEANVVSMLRELFSTSSFKIDVRFRLDKPCMPVGYDSHNDVYLLHSYESIRNFIFRNMSYQLCFNTFYFKNYEKVFK